MVMGREVEDGDEKKEEEDRLREGGQGDEECRRDRRRLEER